MEIKISRSKLYPVTARPGPAWTWSYSYTDAEGRLAQYGTGLSSLRDMLRREYGRTVKIIETWRA